MTLGYITYFLPLAVLYSILQSTYGDKTAIPTTIVAAVIWWMVL